MGKTKSRPHLVFDCDGTLISSSGEVFLQISECLTHYLKREVSTKEVQEKFDPHIEKFYDSFGLDQKAQEEVQAIWIEQARRPREYQLFPGIKDSLESLKEKFELYVWTARDRGSTLSILKDCGVLDLFQDLRTGTDGLMKPHPQGLEEMIGHVQAKEVMVVGDSYTDILGAKSVGALAVGASWCPFSDVERLKSVEADFILSEVDQLIPFVESHFMVRKK